MSKIGRKPIDIKDVSVQIKGQEIHYKGSKGSGVHILPDFLEAIVADEKLMLKPRKEDRDINKFWGLHRALLANKIRGAKEIFEGKIIITGLGYKAKVVGDKIEFALGFSHKITLDLPKEVTLEIDRTGQNLTFRSFDKQVVGNICDRVRSLRPPEPYKGTGIKLADETIVRKAGKTKVAAG